jgi:hypothetical protein
VRDVRSLLALRSRGLGSPGAPPSWVRRRWPTLLDTPSRHMTAPRVDTEGMVLKAKVMSAKGMNYV